MITNYTKDPNAVLDYAWDWSDWLADGETISSHTVTVTGVVKDSDSRTTTSVVAWLSGGTAGTRATATCRITTNQFRTDDRTITLHVAQR